MQIEEFIKKHKPLNVYIEYNEHKSNYQSIEDFFNYDCNEENIVDKEECVKQDTVYRLQVYPNTPIGCYIIFASTLERAIDEMDEFFSKEK